MSVTLPEAIYTPPEARGPLFGIRMFLRNFMGCWPLVLWLVAGVVLSIIPVLINIDGIGKRVSYGFFRRWSRGLLAGFGVRVWLKGVENVAPGRQYIVCANHRSHIDIPVIGTTLPLKVCAVYKRSINYIPFLGQAAIMSRSVAVDRSDKADARRRMGLVRHRMQTGRSIIIFVEGTRSQGATLGPFKKGAAVLAIEQQCPILPVTICGTDVLYPPGSIMIRRGDVLVEIHKPIDTAGSTLGQRDLITDRVKASIEGAFVPGPLDLTRTLNAERLL
jgi:1-acyl-sn-glycerol-3-phosphate acyltransferase